MRVWHILFCLWLGLTAVSRAQSEAETPTPPQPALGDVLRDAVLAYEAGDWERARGLFEVAHAQAPTSRTLRGLGIVALRQGRFVDAVVLLEQSLASQVKPLTDELRQATASALAEARAQLGGVTLQVTPEAREVRVDGEPARYDAAGVLLLTPGPHRLELAFAEGDPHLVEVQAKAGSSELLHVDLPTTPAMAKGEPEAAPPAPLASKQREVVGAQSAARPAPSAARSRRSTRLRIGGRSLLIAAGAAAIVAGVASVLGVVRVGQLEDQCRAHADGRCTLSEVLIAQRKQHLDLLSGLSIGGTIAAGATGASGVTLLWMARRSDLPVRGARAHVEIALRVPF